jgi:hypothetical protein
VWAVSTLFAAAQIPTRRSLRVLRCGLKLSQMIAIWTGWAQDRMALRGGGPMSRAVAVRPPCEARSLGALICEDVDRCPYS